MTTSPHSFRWVLRSATEAAHRRLDELVGASESFQSRNGYRRFLTASACAHQAEERSLADAGYDGPDWLPTPRRSDLARADLAGLGAPAALPDVARVPAPPRSEAAAFGRIYVLEGSALGGAMLARRLGAIGLDPLRCGALLSGVPHRGEGRWPRFLARTERRAWTKNDLDVAQIDANRVFDDFFVVFSLHL